jgi:hypothetical protein
MLHESISLQPILEHLCIHVHTYAGRNLTQRHGQVNSIHKIKGFHRQEIFSSYHNLATIESLYKHLSQIFLSQRVILLLLCN